MNVGFTVRLLTFSHPTVFVPDRAACPTTLALIPAPVYNTVFLDSLSKWASCFTFACMTLGSSMNSDAVSHGGLSWSSRGGLSELQIHRGGGAEASPEALPCQKKGSCGSLSSILVRRSVICSRSTRCSVLLAIGFFPGLRVYLRFFLDFSCWSNQAKPPTLATPRKPKRLK